MREIKFRAWDCFHKEMVTDSVDCHASFLANGEVSNASIFGSELMQYTGLKDKNGVEIYEGDILKRGISNYRSLEDCIGYVEFIQASFFFVERSVTKQFTSNHALGSECKDYLGRVRCVSYEIIGNIYENSELIPTVTPN